MRFETGTAEVTAEGFAERAAFTIAASGKAFKGLIDGLYSRKIEAPIRELATNARDAHVDAKTTLPFEVHLPTILQPTFWIRDYGTGMSHDLMMHRYTTMFDSTKDGLVDGDMTNDCNEAVGMLGLGSKSFFAYTDTCTITNWMDGEVRFYSVFMGADGIPQIALAGRGPSDEPRGVKVEFAVKVRDIADFAEAAIRVFKGFETQPVGLPDAVREMIEVASTHDAGFWRVYVDEYLPGHSLWARQGCVLYPVELGEIDDRSMLVTKSKWVTGKNVEHDVYQLSPRFEALENFKATIIVDFPIGSLEFDLGRERLAYTERTIKAVRQRWDEVICSLDSFFDAMFAGCTNDWTHMALAFSSVPEGMDTLFRQSTHYETAKRVLDGFGNCFPANRTSRADKNWPIHAAIRLAGDTHRTAYHCDGPCSPRGGASGRKEPVGSMVDAIFVFIDTDKIDKLNARAAQYLREHGGEWAFVLNPQLKLTPALFKRLGCPKIVRYSELPKPKSRYQPQASSRGGKGGGGIFQRVKVIDNFDGYSDAAEPAQYEGHSFALLNCGEIITPPGLDVPKFSVSDVILCHHAMMRFKGQSISLLNIKKNEFSKLDKLFGPIDYFYGKTDDLFYYLTKSDIRDLVDMINYDRFQNSLLDNLLDRWEMPHCRDRLHALRRFDRRHARIQNDDNKRRLLRAMIGNARIFPGLTDFVIESARQYGFETLPEQLPQSSGRYPYDLLPKRWMKFVHNLKKCQPPSCADTKNIVYESLKGAFSCHS